MIPVRPKLLEYLRLPLPPLKAVSNHGLDRLLRKAGDHNLSVNEHWKVERAVKNRLTLYYQAFNWICELGFQDHWPQYAVGGGRELREFLQDSKRCNMFVLERNDISPWIGARNLVDHCFVRAGVSGGDFDRLYDKKFGKRWLILKCLLF